MKISGIYKIQSVKNPERCYIGSASDIYQRWRCHRSDLRANKHHSVKLQRHFNKHGEEDLIFSVIISCDKEDMTINEQYFMDTYKSYFNSSPTAGNCLGVRHSEETRKRMSHHPSVETRIKISEGAKGNKNWLGKHHTEESKEKIRLANIGKKQSDEIKMKRSNAMKGKNTFKRTDAQKQNMRIAQLKRRLQNDRINGSL